MIANVSDVVPRAGARASRQTDTEYVTFRVGAQWLGIPVLMVQEVLAGQRITRVPLAPPEVSGFLNLRGRIVTAVDLRVRLQLPVRAEDSGTVSVVVRDEEELFSFLVDEVGDVMAVGAQALEPPPATLDARWKQCCDGIVRRDKDLLVVVSAREMLHLEQAS
jgi:purine-binding chemotaxis protein CheW